MSDYDDELLRHLKNPIGLTLGVALTYQQAYARIRELEAELDALKSDLSGYMDAATTYVNELHGVHTGTHVIVPVEPTPKMVSEGFQMMCGELDKWEVSEVYRAMIRAAQPDNQKGE